MKGLQCPHHHSTDHPVMSQSHSEPPLDLKIIHNKSSVSSEILQDYSRISSSSLHDFLDNYSSMHFRAVTNPSSPQNSRLLF